MKRLVCFLTAVLLYVTVITSAFAQEKTEYPELPEWWTKLTPFEQFTLVKTRMGDVISEQARIKPALREYLVKYPFTGLGILYGPSVKNEKDGNSLNGVKVVSVWKNSPAARAGILPGDWLVKVNRYDICSDGDGKPPRYCIDNALDAFRSISVDMATSIEVEREGKFLEFMVFKEPGIGQELALAIEQFTPDLEFALAVQREILDELANTVAEMYGNPVKLYFQFVELEKMRDFHAAIFTLLSEEEKNLQLWEEQ